MTPWPQLGKRMFVFSPEYPAIDDMYTVHVVDSCTVQRRAVEFPHIRDDRETIVVDQISGYIHPVVQHERVCGARMWTDLRIAINRRFDAALNFKSLSRNAAWTDSNERHVHVQKSMSWSAVSWDIVYKTTQVWSRNRPWLKQTSK